MTTESKSTLYCSFCGKSQHEVQKLIAGPTVFICDECVTLCGDIIDEEHTRPKSVRISVAKSTLERLGNVQLQSLRKLLRNGGLEKKGKGEKLNLRELLEAVHDGIRLEMTQVEMTAERAAAIKSAQDELDTLTKSAQIQYENLARPLQERIAALQRGSMLEDNSAEVGDFPEQPEKPDPPGGLETAILTHEKKVE